MWAYLRKTHGNAIADQVSSDDGGHHRGMDYHYGPGVEEAFETARRANAAAYMARKDKQIDTVNWTRRVRAFLARPNWKRLLIQRFWIQLVAFGLLFLLAGFIASIGSLMGA